MAPRCARHGLGAGPDGLCAICHRELRASEPPRPGQFNPNRVLWAIMGATAVGLGAVAVIRHRPAPMANLPSARPMLVTVVPSTTQAEPAPTGVPAAASWAAPENSANIPVRSEPQPQPSPSALALAPTSSVRASGNPVQLTPSASEVQRVMANIPITLYEADWCPHCRRAKAWFAAQRLNVTDYDVDHNAQARRDITRYNSRGSLPTIVIEEQVLIGFSEDQVAQTLASIASRRLGVQVSVRTR